MANYRRAYVKGGCYFFTAVTWQRNPILTEHICLLREAFRRVKATHPFELGAVVVLPDHIHCLMTLPDEDDDFSTRWRLIKSGFTRAVASMRNRQDSQAQPVWQERFWEHLIRDGEDLRRHMDYIHYNPVKHGYVQAASDWPYSSFHGCVARGLYSSDWADDRELLFDVE